MLPPQDLLPPLILPRRTLRWEDGPYLMGILNTTPDSFSDGGLHLNRDRAVAAGLEMVVAGATFLDVGGESTRPGSDPVSAQEEMDRVVPVIEALRGETDALISVDTTKAAVAEAALDAGADLVNDISGMTFDAGMATLVSDRQVPVVLMHIRGRPKTMMLDTGYKDVVSEVSDHLMELVARAEAANIPKHRLILDAGIGFGKNLEGNLRLIHHSATLAKVTGCPVLVGPSRKKFIGELLREPDPMARDWGSAGAVVAAAWCGAHIIRVHEVGAMAQALTIAMAIRRAI